MSLAAGTRLGPYEILAPLGAGGMGEVYRARDGKLDRDVAVKVLPQATAADPDALARFEREAKAVAALSHPNILSIFDFGHQGGVAYAVMELLEGETLRGKLDAGPITQKQAVDYTLQIAKGLAAAHERGIVHRDLKPENLFVSRDGHVKILDFGLAKRVESIAPGEETSAPTGSGHTEPGTVMGTAGYMSPEQVKGLPVDHRSDIFSFGAILYEVLSGNKAFKRPTNVETMAAILRDEPPELSESGRNVSPALDRVVRHCLEKDRDHRFQSARDIAFNLSDPSSPGPAIRAPKAAAPAGPPGFRIAVLPFKCGTADADVLALADGLSEEIVNGLSRFRYLSVATAASTRLSTVEGDNAAPAGGSGARYVVEGSLRREGSDLRISAQLVDAQTGARLWSETYRRDLRASGTFAVQDDVAGRIVATVADSYGVLVHSIRDAGGHKDDATLTPVEWQFQYFAYREQITPSSYAALKSRLERAVERDGRQSDLWACLAQVYVDEYAFGFGGDAVSLDRALAAARRAVELDRANQFALVALAQVHFFRQDLAAFGPAAERAMALNPLNTDAIGILGLQIVHTGEFERGAAIVRRAMELNPNHAGWMHFAPLWEHFHNGEYEQALERANRVDVPGLFWPFLVVASACGHLGRRAEAESAVRDLLALDPDFAAHVRSNVGTWHFASGLMGPILDGLRKAGLAIPAEDGSAPARETATSSGRIASGAVGADDGFWVAVLPFRYGGADASLTALAEGLSEEIVTGLSRFSYLRVISRSAPVESRSAGKPVDARYVMEGSLRQAGTKLRLAVQLVDATSGAHLWAENFERTFSPETVFEIQDDLVPRIVSTVADMHGVLPRSMSEVVRLKAADQMSPYEALLRSFGYNERFTPEDLAEVRTCLERAVQQAPGNAECWAMLSVMYANEYGHWDSAAPDSLDRSLRAARTAVEAAPLHSLPYYALAQALFFKREIPAFRVAAERAVSLNPTDGATAAFMGLLIAYAGDWERGCALSEKGSQLNPNHPGWYRYTAWHDAYRKKDYRTALDVALRLNAPQNYYTHAVLAMCYAQLGQMEEARKALADMLALKPNYAEVARELHGRWIEPDLVEQLMDGLRKAGLEIGPAGGAAGPPSAPARSSSTDAGAARADEGFWVAVLPFKYGGADASLTALAEGLTEEIVTGLSRFSYLRVISRSAPGDSRSAGKQVGARYIMEGSLRQSGTRLRIAVQLVDAVSGAHLWAENYERSFSPEAVFELQDELVPRIVSTVADMHGVLPRSMSEIVRGRTPEQLSPYEAVLRSFGYFELANREELAAARSGLESAVRRAPAYAEAWAMLSILCTHAYGQAFNRRPDSLTTGFTAARRAVDAAPSNHLAWFSLAQALFFQKEFQSFRNAAERAVALNPMDGDSIATLGGMLTCAGDLERGLALTGRAKQLNPHHPGWYWWVDFCNAYRQGDYRAALGFALKMNLPGHWFMHAAMSAAYGQLGERAAASKALQDLLEMRPDFGATVRMNIEKWWGPDFVEHLMDGWRKAGLEVPTENATAAPPPDFARSSAADSGAARADEGFWVAVLPFKAGGTEPTLMTLADGLTEDLVTGLSRFSYLKVIARAATADGRSARDLGARYVMEGSLRHAGSRLRVAVQLVDAVTGAHLWAENYERTFSPDGMFELQDELAPRIVSTVADMNGVLPRSMSQVVRSRAPEQLSPYEAVLRSFAYFERVTAEELSSARAGLELAVQKAPAHADAWAMLALLCVQDYAQGFDLQADSLPNGATAARRAVETAPSNPLAHFSLAQALFFQKEFRGFRNAAERAVALNPMDGNSIAFLGELLTYAGDRERGMELAGRAKQLNPNHPGWYWYADFYDAYRRGDDRGAVNFALKADLPGHWGMPAALAAAYGQLGEREAARRALRDLLKLRPDFATTARRDSERWWEPEYVDRMIDGWRKAGLDIDEKGVPVRPEPSGPAESISAARADEGFWVAVLPFQHSGGDAGLAALAEGMTDEIVTGLSRFSYLRVISRTSTRRYSSGAADVRTVGKELGARYVLDGSLRQAGSAIRISVQLIDAVSGANLWAETYNRSHQPEAIFDVQDDVVRRIVSTVADTYGVLPHSMSEALRGKNPDELTPYEAVIRGLAQLISVSADDHASVRAGLERAVEEAPGNADCWALLSNMCREEYAHGFNLKPDPLGRALVAARRAVEIAPSNHLAYHALATTLFLRGELSAFRSAAERSIALNPMDGFTMAYLGSLVAYSGDWERGCAMAKQARELNPLHPGWYWFSDCFNAYRQGDDRAALDIARKIQMPGFWRANLARAATYGQLGERESAARALRELLTLRPNFATEARAELQKWWEPDLVERLMDGLRKAGLETADNAPASAPVKAAESGAIRADEGFWVAVLPFHHSGGDPSLTTLADGLSDEIVTGLSRFSYLRVISQASTRRYSSGAADVRTVGRELGARYVLDGSLRQAGPVLRASIQLIDADSGAHLWAETYERPFRTDAVFELQDDLVSRIVATVGDPHGILPHTMSESLRTRDHGELSPYEAVLRSFGFGYRSTAEEHAVVRNALEKAVRDAPRHADAWAMLSLIYTHEYAYEFNVLPDPLGRALDAARRAAALAPTSAVAYDALAWALFFRKEVAAFRAAADQSVALNPLSSPALAGLGTLTAYSGEWEKGCAMVKRALQLNPRHPGWYRFALFADAYRRRDYRGAVDIALKLNLPDFYVTHEVLAAAYGQLGQRDAAAKALKELLRLRPDYAETGREKLEKWFDADLVDHWMDGLRKAGLGVPAAAASRTPEKASSPSEVSIAVLPFSDMSPAKDQEYLCEGMAEEIMNALVGVGGMRVASRTSAFRARRQGGDLPAIARALSVGHVLEGSIRTAGSRLRVTAQLTDVASGYQLWSERFDREAADVFAVQDEIAAGVVEAVKARLAPGEHAVPARPQPANLDAYRSYLKGRHLRGKEHLVDALRAFEEATRLDPSYAPSWTGLAEATVLASVFGLIPARDACAAAREALATATRLQGESADGLHVEAFAAWIEKRWAAGETAWRRAIELQPNHVLALASFGIVLCTRQRLDEALPFFERARHADPLASFPYTLTGGGLLGCGRLEEALRYLDDALSFEKEDATALDDSGMALVALGRFDEGIARLEHVVALTHRAPHFLGTLDWALATAGREDEAREILAELRGRPPGSPSVVSEAWLLGALGELDAAFDVIARAEEECLAYVYFTGLPAFDSLRADPRFRALLERLDLPPERE